MAHGLSRDLAQQAVDAFSTYGTKQAAADALGLPVTTLKHRLRIAAQYGLDGSVMQASAEGRVIKGVSTLYGSDGLIKAQWVKEWIEDESAQVLQTALLDVFKDYKGHAVLPPSPRASSQDLMTVYPISDQHLGMYAWADEAGEDYDLEIGSELLRSAMTNLVSSSMPSRQALILVLGDFFHSDNLKNQTSKSGNPLDVDTRYAKVVRTGIELLLECIELALQKHRDVTVKVLSGNHDEASAICLSAALHLFFKGNRRVQVDPSPARVWCMQFGANMIAATHGDTIKMKDFPGVMAGYWPVVWGATRFRYGYTGHVHHNSSLEKDGAIVSSFQTLAAKDAFHYGAGYSAGRSMVAITLHVEKGEIARCTVAV